MTSVSWKPCTALAGLAVVAACSGSPQNLTSPSAATGGETTAAADGSTLKATAPELIAPVNGATVDTLRPTLSWGPSTGSFVSVSPGYELHVLQGGTVIYTAIVAETAHQVAADATPDTEYQWRVRARLDGAVGPWSSLGTFRTAAARVAASSLPFQIPASCGPIPNPPGNRIQCAVDIAQISPEWGGCVGGSGTRCHRFARHVAAALAAGDPNWGLIGKNPGEQQCTWNRCGGLNGEGYGEDVVAYLAGPNVFNNWIGFDIVGGAGAPGATVGWNGPLSRRAGNYWAPVPVPIDQ